MVVERAGPAVRNPATIGSPSRLNMIFKGRRLVVSVACAGRPAGWRPPPRRSRVWRPCAAEGSRLSLSIVSSARPDGVIEISPRGEIDVDTAYELRDEITVMLREGSPARIELNMRLVTFIDAVGISAMVTGFQLCEARGVRLVVTQPSRFVHRQLWVTGLLGLFGAPEPYFADDTPALALARERPRQAAGDGPGPSRRTVRPAAQPAPAATPSPDGSVASGAQVEPPAPADRSAVENGPHMDVASRVVDDVLNLIGPPPEAMRRAPATVPHQPAGAQ